MIAAGLLLVAIGAADLVREFMPASRRWIGFAVGGVLLAVIGALSAALPVALIAIAVAALWVWLAPSGARPRAGFWPVVLVGAAAALSVAVLPPRADAGIIGALWSLPSPVGPLTFDHVALLAGTTVFLLESANVVVRTALYQERVEVVGVTADPPLDTDDGEDAASPRILETEVARDAVADPDSIAPVDPATVTPAESAAVAGSTLKGGRLIGPLERLMVFALTLAAMYPLLAAVLAAKGIVRFPEISRDSAVGNRAEYFLIGSLVSWVLALAGALLVWWAFATPVP
ncbi:hypothetical protein ABZ477_18360 [Microbacterium sp. NPDC019599]|uniref:hypothetical protein n=1 Tax=Microbacterium sp. NPDC019599 TaxID=3154690 RepID=UPI0033E30255